MGSTSDDSKKVSWWPLVLTVLLVIIFWGLLGTLSYWWHCKVEPGGKFWDSFGAINALFAGLAFAVVIYAILLQKKELELQREELQATRNEIKEQKETLQKQNFESSFFQLLRFHNEIVNSVKGQTSQYSGRKYFAHLLLVLRKQYREKIEECEPGSCKKDILKATCEKCFTIFDPNVGYYFRHLYNFIKFLDQSDPSIIKEKKFYTDLIRAQLSSDELGLLFFWQLVV